MSIKLSPDKDIRVRKKRVDNVPVLSLKPAKPARQSATNAGLLWIHAGVEAEADVYHTDMHAFDMLRDDDLSREAIEAFNQHFEYALEHFAGRSRGR